MKNFIDSFLNFRRNLLITVLLIFTFIIPMTINADIASEEIASGFDVPVFVTSPEGDTARLFVVEQSGLIKILKNGSVLASPFIDLTDSLTSGGEGGLLGLAFHPEYSSNGYYFVNYTDQNGDTKIVRGKVSTNPDLAETDSLDLILMVDQPRSNHNAGMLAFSPLNGYLYIGMGDGGGSGDPDNLAQDSGTLLGKMLRIDVDNGSPYAVPSDNPYLGNPQVPDEIWSFGLRNPWRYSFDRETGDLYIADVGQNNWEEINFESAESTGGLNYGWRLTEGNQCYNPSTNCDPGNLTYPIHVYSHSDGCSVSGGYVYRGCALPEIEGMYFFADFCSGRIWSFSYDGMTLTDFTERTGELEPDSYGSFSRIASFGEDANGELYIVDRGLGSIFKIVSSSPIDCNGNGYEDRCDIILGKSFDLNDNGIPDECETGYICGDPNNDEIVDISDAVFLINYVFVPNSDAPDPLDSGNVNCDDRIDISDAVYIINYIFVPDSPEPCNCS